MLAPWKKRYDQSRKHIKKQRYYFADKGPYSQSYGFPVVMYGCESWTIEKAEHGRIDAFELWCWRRLLRVSWIARRSNQSILKEISPEYSLEGLMLKLKLQYFGLTYWERGELPPSSGLFLPYLVLIERLKEISPGCSLEGLMLKLKLQYFGHLMRRADSFEKTLMERLRAGREGDDRG